MLSVGNDVVDLDDPEARIVHPRFAERIGAAGDVWFHFAAKEAAYKALRKIEPGIRPIPRRFVVSADGRTVEHGALSVRLATSRGDGYVHVVALAGDAELVAGVAEARPEEHSEEARRRLCLAVGARLGLDPQELQVERLPDPLSWDGKGPPRLLHRDEPLALDISLSHHGRFVAWAAALPGA